MATNRFDKPILSEYVSLYTPIPFELLYAIGKANNERVDRAYQDLGNAFTRWSEFRSPSAVDTKRHYDLTIGGALDLVNELAANPDLIKTAEGRSRIQSFINSRPYAELSQLQQSRDNMIKRNDIVAKLKAENKYKESWDPYADLTNYDTLNSGILNDLAPTPFASLEEIASPYTAALKPSFYAGATNPNTGERLAWTKGWNAITLNDIARSLNIARNDILATPQGQNWYRDIASAVYSQNPEATEADVNNVFMNALVTSQADKITHSPVDDAIGFAQWKFSQTQRGKNPSITSETIPFTELLSAQGSNRIENLKRSYFNNTNVTKVEELNNRYKSALEAGNDAEAEAALKEYDNAINSISTKETIGAVLKLFSQNGYLVGDNLRSATNVLSSQLINGYRSNAALDAVLQHLPNVSTEKQKTAIDPENKKYILTGAGDMNLLSNTLINLAGMPIDKMHGTNKILDYIRNNRVLGIVTGSRGYITIPTINGSSNINVSTVAISKKDLLPLTNGDEKALARLMHDIGAVHKSVIDGEYNERREGSYNDDGEWEPKKKSARTYTGKTEDEYYELDFTSLIPKTSDPLYGTSINNTYDQLTRNSADYSDEYPSRQQQMNTARNFWNNYDEEE